MRIYFFGFLSILLCSFLHGEDFNSPNEVINIHIEKWMNEYSIPGVAVAVVYQGKSYLYAFGFANKEKEIPVTNHTIFELASITKVFTSTALAIEVLDGKMALNDPVDNYLPSLKNSTQPISLVKLIDLATHTSSLPRVPPKHTVHNKAGELIQFLRRWTPTYPIGQKYAYSNFGFALLGQAITNAAEENTYDEMIKKLITSPLQMNSTEVKVPSNLLENYAQGYNKKGHLAPHLISPAWPGGGALRSTGADMIKFLEANLNIKGPESLLKAMQMAQQEYFRVKNNFSMGLGWQRFYHKGNFLIVDKNGGLPGFSTYIGMIPEKKIGIVLLANKARTSPTRMGRQILSALQNAN